MTTVSKKEQLNQDSEALMGAFLGGQERAFYQLVALWKKPLLNYFYHQLHVFSLAEELTQEVFIRVFKTQKYQAQGLFSAWIYRIAQNILRDYLRKNKLKVLSSEDYPGIQERLVAKTGLEEDLLEQAEIQQQVYCVLECLSFEEQQIIILSQIQDLAYQEVAEMMQISLNSIKGKIFRAVKKFSKRFKEAYPHDESS